MKNINIVSSKKWMKEKISLRILSIYAICIIFASFILYDLYGHVFDSIIISFGYWLLIIIVIYSKKITKGEKIINILHILLIILAILIPIILFYNVPHYTINQAINIVERDITKKGIEIHSELHVRKKSSNGNLIVHEDYEIHLDCGDMTYVYVFDPLKGKYSLTGSYSNK